MSNSISRPARKSRKDRPSSATTEIASSAWTIPSTDGPITIPAMISTTTEGSFTEGKKPRSSGAAKATETTISRLSKPGIAGFSGSNALQSGQPSLTVITDEGIVFTSS